MSRKRGYISTPKQRAVLQRGSIIRSLCGIYAQTSWLHTWDHLSSEEYTVILNAIDQALIRIRGESETVKRIRQREEALSREQ